MEKIFKYFVFFIILMFIIAITLLSLYIWVVVWIYKVSKDKTCTCAKNWRRLYIVIFPLISFLLVVPLNSLPKSYIRWIQFPESIGWILFIIFSFQYLKGLKRMNCECALKEKSGDNALMAMSIMYIVLFVFAFTAMIAFLSIFAWLARQ